MRFSRRRPSGSGRNIHDVDAKICNQCGEGKPLTAYYLDKGKPRAKCKDCHKRKMHDHRQTAEWRAWKEKYDRNNRDRHAEAERNRRARERERINRARREARAADPERFRAQQREYRVKNVERVRAAQRLRWELKKDRVNARLRERRATDPEWAERQRETQRRTRNPAKASEANRRWRQANPDKVRLHLYRRRALKAMVEHQPYTRTEIYERDGGRCKICGVELKLEPNGFHIDHIVPISLGGPDIPANVQLSCQPCNNGKHANLEGQIHLPV